MVAAMEVVTVEAAVPTVKEAATAEGRMVKVDMEEALMAKEAMEVVLAEAHMAAHTVLEVQEAMINSLAEQVATVSKQEATAINPQVDMVVATSKAELEDMVARLEVTAATAVAQLVTLSRQVMAVMVSKAKAKLQAAMVSKVLELVATVNKALELAVMVNKPEALEAMDNKLVATVVQLAHLLLVELEDTAAMEHLHLRDFLDRPVSNNNKAERRATDLVKPVDTEWTSMFALELQMLADV